MNSRRKSQTRKSLEKELTTILGDYLTQTNEGRRLVEEYKRDRSQGALPLTAYLRQQLAEDSSLADQVTAALQNRKGPITNVVNDSHVDQIINVNQLDDLLIQSTKQFFVFRDLKQIIIPLLLVVGMMSIAGGTYWYFDWKSKQPERMPDDGFNIVIAQFGQATAKGVQVTDRTASFAIALCNYLDNEAKADNFGLNVRVNHKNMPVISQENEAEKLAQTTNADLVVYGNITVEGDTGQFLPRFYVAGRNGADEVSGYNQLARPIRFNIDFDSEAQLQETLRGRAIILTNFIKGLVYLNIRRRNPVAAEYAFQQAVNEAEQLESEKIKPFEGQEVLYLMLAAAQRMQGKSDNRKFDIALKNLNKALDLNSGYARAMIGIGNNYYDQYNAGDADPILLDQAWSEYQAAQEASDRPPSAHIEEKANIGLGNILFVQAQGDRALLPDVIARYNLVIQSYEQNPTPALGRLVAYAYHNLGWVYDVQGDFVASKDAYQHCAALPTDYDLKEDCQAQLNAIANHK